MSQGMRQSDLQRRAEQLLEGPLKHVKAAALAAALLPLASVAATPASAQTLCPSGGVCGIVFDDANKNGVQDVGETGIPEVKVVICQLCDGTDTIEVYTGPDGTFSAFVPPGPTTIGVLIPTGTQASPPNVGDDTYDSDGVPDGNGHSVATNPDGTTSTDFGFFTPAVSGPGTGTPGYWKNHPNAWPVENITVGGVTYTKAQAIAWLSKVGKDKSTTMFSSLVPAMLNVLVGNDGSCVSATIAAANAWMTTYPVGSGVSASSAAWSLGEPLHITLDNYNNGRLCAPHRN
jgi:SdrD B-like domain